MATFHYKVQGGWQAEDDEYFMACFGLTIADAESALCAAQDRARMIEYRLALAPETDLGLDADDLAAIAEAQADVARGDFEVVHPRRR